MSGAFGSDRVDDGTEDRWVPVDRLSREERAAAVAWELSEFRRFGESWYRPRTSLRLKLRTSTEFSTSCPSTGPLAIYLSGQQSPDSSRA